MVSRRTNFGEPSEPAPDRGGKLQSAGGGRHKETFHHCLAQTQIFAGTLVLSLQNVPHLKSILSPPRAPSVGVYCDQSLSGKSGVSTSIKAHNFVQLLRGPLSISVASNSKLDLFPKTRYPERFSPCSKSYIRFRVCHANDLNRSRAKLCASIDVKTPRLVGRTSCRPHCNERII